MKKSEKTLVETARANLQDAADRNAQLERKGEALRMKCDCALQALESADDRTMKMVAECRAGQASIDDLELVISNNHQAQEYALAAIADLFEYGCEKEQHDKHFEQVREAYLREVNDSALPQIH